MIQGDLGCSIVIQVTAEHLRQQGCSLPVELSGLGDVCLVQRTRQTVNT